MRSQLQQHALLKTSYSDFFVYVLYPQCWGGWTKGGELRTRDLLTLKFPSLDPPSPAQVQSGQLAWTRANGWPSPRAAWF